ncbi:Chromatin assembly factor 1 subunit [Malassezia vespertilionis]|uniref:CAF1B/HIR1 beta-propeller domain-containing protein n=1 Tax=Malassezia vespertilionis TaxID=2020962 RepID=A0A2N1J9T0_9BASI|nr:Chromatin assembly factor 1 subunit [Malassezia vespertilionis]PKI83308.1 hypothetical protein MVES_002804 [Malassezia vespertilionis]WFD07589.1 Chromatin assembly factor 1 subunit [Malassezia vespertilionis]
MPSPAALAASESAKPYSPRVEYAATLARHTGVVNVVRFSPSGELLASAGDDGNVLFWVRSDSARPSFGESASTEPDKHFEKEVWRVRLMVRASAQELYDMAWSPDGRLLAVGGTDFTTRIINVADGTVAKSISDHQHYVQGVAWDPRNQFLATESSDRSVCMYDLQRGSITALDPHLASRQSRMDMTQGCVRPNAQADGRVQAPRLAQHPSLGPTTRLDNLHARPAAPGTPAQRLYGDDRYSSFFRRLSFSPDGAFLATPTGQFLQYNAEGKPDVMASAVYLHARGNFRRACAPIAALPGHKTATVAVRFSPILYHLRVPKRSPCGTEKNAASCPAKEAEKSHDSHISMFALPYRMVYAVATHESVWIYDTQQSGPLCCFSNLHYASFTDLSWSPDGQILMMSSSDGYCSVAVFDYNELGEPIAHAEQPALKETRSEAFTTIPAAPEPTQPEPVQGGTQALPSKKRRVALTFEGPLPP